MLRIIEDEEVGLNETGRDVFLNDGDEEIE
jgi:hypothetical protein